MKRDLCFATFRFETDSGRLWSGANEIRLTPKAAAVLKALLARAGHPVSKQDLFASVWEGTIVGDDALTSCIQELRKALSDDAKQPRFIETRHRLGYLFVAPVAESATSDLSTIAVLPFIDMSAGRDQDYLCEGLAEELINALTHVEGLRVASRTSSFQFNAVGADVRDIGRKLNVGTLLEGSVRKAGNRLRVTVQLIEVETGFHRWSERFDRNFDDVFAIQDEIAQRVAASLGTVLDRRSPAAATPAYEDYLRGRQLLPRMTQPDLKRSAAMFERSISLDRDYAPSWAGLATAHATLYEWFGAEQQDLDRAESASQRAIELAPDLAETHVARGFVASLSRQYDEAAREFEAARRINPRLFDAYYYDARANFARGDILRSAELFAKAADARHDDYQSPLLLSQSLRMLGRFDEERDALREGLRRIEHALALNPLDARAMAMASAWYFFDGQLDRARALSKRSLELYPNDLTVLVAATCLHARLGLKEEALGYFERVAALGWGKRDWVEHDPDYESLRGDPRFEKILAKLK